MREPNHRDTNVNNIEINISAADSIDAKLISTFYTEDILQSPLIEALAYISEQLETNLTLPYFTEINDELWQQKPKALDIYIIDGIEGRELNLEARGKDYPTNILSYPSEMPTNIIELMPMLPLGELVICHEVVVREAAEQGKAVAQHISHLLIHGVLHLLGFDHMAGQAEQDEMERFEIDILERLALPNPYL